MSSALEVVKGEDENWLSASRRYPDLRETDIQQLIRRDLDDSVKRVTDAIDAGEKTYTIYMTKEIINLDAFVITWDPYICPVVINGRTPLIPLYAFNGKLYLTPWIIGDQFGDIDPECKPSDAISAKTFLRQAVEYYNSVFNNRIKTHFCLKA